MSEKTTNNELLTAAAVGEMLSLSTRQIFRLNSSGKLPAPLKISGATRWRSQDIQNYIAWGAPSRMEFEARKEAGHVR